MGKYHQGKFTPTNPGKYKGDVDKIVYRSSWERSALRWLDENDGVASYSSEEIFLKYVCATDGKEHRYFVDLLIEFVNGEKVLVEIKPKYQTRKPKPGANKKKFATDMAIWHKNVSKWRTAMQVAKDNGMIFEVWTEDTLAKMGIKIIRS